MSNISVSAKLREIDLIKKSPLAQETKDILIKQIQQQIEEYAQQGSLFHRPQQEKETPPAKGK